MSQYLGDPVDDGRTPGQAEVELQKEAVFAAGDMHTFFLRVTGADRAPNQR